MPEGWKWSIIAPVRGGEHLSDMFPIRKDFKQGDALSSLFLNFALEYSIRRVHINQDDSQFNDIHQLLVYADDINTLGRSIHTIKKNTEFLVIASKEIRLEVNADKTKYMVMSRDQNAR